MKKIFFILALFFLFGCETTSYERDLSFERNGYYFNYIDTTNDILRQGGVYVGQYYYAGSGDGWQAIIFSEECINKSTEMVIPMCGTVDAELRFYGKENLDKSYDEIQEFGNFLCGKNAIFDFTKYKKAKLGFMETHQSGAILICPENQKRNQIAKELETKKKEEEKKKKEELEKEQKLTQEREQVKLYKETCSSYGFVENTNDFSYCILELKKIDEQRAIAELNNKNSNIVVSQDGTTKETNEILRDISGDLSSLDMASKRREFKEQMRQLNEYQKGNCSYLFDC